MQCRCLLAALALASGYQLSAPRARVPLERTGTPVAGLFDGVFGSADPPAQRKRDSVAEEQFQAMKDMQEKRRNPVEYEIEKNKRRNVELATRAALAGNIPSGWGSAIDPESGDRYFFDAETKEGATFNPQDMIEEMVALLEEKQRKEMQDLIDSV